MSERDQEKMVHPPALIFAHPLENRPVPDQCVSVILILILIILITLGLKASSAISAQQRLISSLSPRTPRTLLHLPLFFLFVCLFGFLLVCTTVLHPSEIAFNFPHLSRQIVSPHTDSQSCLLQALCPVVRKQNRKKLGSLDVVEFDI